MHSRHRSSADPFRSGGGEVGGGSYLPTLARRSFTRRKFSSPKPHYHSNHHAPPPPTAPRKAEAILHEAGRFAAEYLVSKGLIPASLLPSPPRATALSRLRFDTSSAAVDRDKQFVKSHRRPSPYGRSCSSSRENTRDRMSNDDENDDGYDEHGEAAPGFNKSGRIEVVGESADDSASKVSSSSTRKDMQMETEVNSTKDHLGEDNCENDDVEMRDFTEGIEELEDDKGHDLLKFLSVSRVPTRPRSSSVQRNVKHVEETNVEEKSNVSEVVSGDLQKSVGDEKKTEDNVSVPHEQLMEQDIVEKQNESNEVAPAIEKEEHLAPTSANEEKALVKENDYSLNNLEGGMLSHYDGPIIKEKPVIIDSGLCDKEEQRQLLPTSFKILDLNLMECPEMSEVHDNPASIHLSAASPAIGDMKEHASEFHLSLVNSIGNLNKRGKLPDTDKVVRVIDLEDDSPAAPPARHPGPQSSSIYQDTNPALNSTEHPIDLHNMQDNYNLIAPDLLGNDISGCSTVQPDLNNLQNSFGLPGTEVFPGDDIYESFGGLPMGFMEVWDQPPQEYGNYF